MIKIESTRVCFSETAKVLRSFQYLLISESAKWVIYLSGAPKRCHQRNLLITRATLC